jgi:twitching motility protein PilT
MSDSRAVGELLVERKVLSRDALEEVLAREDRSGVDAVALVVADGMVGERDVFAAIASHAGLAAWNPIDAPISLVVRAMIPVGLARELRSVAVHIDDATLVVAMEQPTDAEVLAKLAKATGWRIAPAMATAADITAALDDLYGAVDDDPASPVTPGAGPASARPAPSASAFPADPPTGAPPPHLNVLLTRMVELGASDLHLSNERAPSVRIDGRISPLDDWPVLSGSQVRDLVYGVLPSRKRERFEADLELDTSHSIPGVGRFRMNVFLQRDTVGAVVRAIPRTIVPLRTLGLPPAVAELSRLQRGFVLVTGPTGSGKSTTLASLIDVVNTTRACHIMTVENPIEFLHSHKTAVVNQREVGEDTHSFAEALRHVLRQDPDVILVGELRDLETISAALTAAETGHLVFGTLHTLDAPQAVDRIVDVFPAHQQQQIRVQLAATLQAVVSQQLLVRCGDAGRVVAAEVLIATAAVRNLIRSGKIHQLYSVMQGGAQYGMRTMDHSLAELVRNGEITLETAIEHSHNEDDVRRLAHAGR